MSGINTGIQTISQRVYLNNEDNYRTNLFYPMIDAVLIGLNDHFFVHNVALCPDSDTFLDIEIFKTFAVKIKVDFCSLSNEIKVIKSMVKDPNTKLENIIDSYDHLLLLK